jgi:hypothetical protein
MTGVDGRWKRRIAAVEAALGLLDEAGVDQERQIDVFGLCEQVGLWLAFAPLDAALGAYVAKGAGGILITTQRPLTVQRYTVAHELGHWRLGHGAAADCLEQVFGATSAEHENSAQVFAASLLLPPPLVMSILARVRPSPHEPVTPQQCYTLAREAGVSYEATVRQLHNLNQISAPLATELLRERPLTIKTTLGHGRRPINGWADVWPVDERWDEQILSLRLEDEAVISLPENRSTGYRWMLADDPVILDPKPPPPAFGDTPSSHHNSEARSAFLQALEASHTAPSRAPGEVVNRLRARARQELTEPMHHEPRVGVDLVDDQYVPSRAPAATQRDARSFRLTAAQPPADIGTPTPRAVAGATGRRLLGVRFGEPGVHTLRLVYRSPYTTSEPLEDFALHAFVETRRNGISVTQLASDASDESWVSEVRERQLSEPPPPLDPNDPALTELPL